MPLCAGAYWGNVMIENFIIVAEQSIIIFLFVSIGYILGKIGVLSKESEECFSALYMYLTGPALTIYTFQRPFNNLMLHGFLTCLVLSVAGIALCIIMARFMVHGETEAQANVYRSSTIFTSCGMVGYALQRALYGAEGIFYGVAYCSLNSIVTWTYGVSLLSGKQNEINYKKVFLNPGVISSVIGLLLFFNSITLTGSVYTVAEAFANMHLPVSMLALGCRLSGIKFSQMLSGKMTWISSLESLVLFPLVCTAVFWLVGMRGMFPVIVIIALASPAGATTTMFAIHYRNNASIAAKLISLQTILSLITLPLLIPVVQKIFS